MEVKQIGSWRDLAKFFEEPPGAGIIQIFRGVVKDDYELLPKIGRPDVIGTQPSYMMEKQMLRHFKMKAHPYAEQISIKSPEIDWLVVGQHHGLPTRLLDWTLNPLVAAFFAVEWKGNNGDVAIYVEQLSGPVKSSQDMENIFEIEKVEFLFPTHFTSRISAQNGLFTAHPDPQNPYNTDSLVKLVVPSGLRRSIQAQLNLYGINRGSLFPGLDGICEQLAWDCRWMAWSGVVSD